MRSHLTGKLISVFAMLALVLWARLTTAADFKSLDWHWSTSSEDFYFAGTVNSDGYYFAQYCYFELGTCVYVVSLGITCKAGDEYPALINSDSAATPVTLTCTHKSGNRCIFTVGKFADVDRVVRTSTHFEVAVATANDQSKTHFSLAGSKYAIDQMRSAAAPKMKAKPQN